MNNSGTENATTVTMRIIALTNSIISCERTTTEGQLRIKFLKHKLQSVPIKTHQNNFHDKTLALSASSPLFKFVSDTRAPKVLTGRETKTTK